MRLFIDTEFNGFGGDLISLGIAAENGEEWYGVLEIPEWPAAWVKENVLPYLAIEKHNGEEMGIIAFTKSLERFILHFPNAEIIADWPSDLEHICYIMTYAGQKAGYRMPIECTMRLTRGGDTKPKLPHNALSDARALRDWYLTREKE